ncbi:MAG: DUF6797 domain-containing protein [Planctomycetota bacterium]
MRLPIVAAVASFPSFLLAQEPDAMQYGPCLTTTLEAGGQSGTTTKALVVRTDGGTVAFDTELLRIAAAWTDGWLRLRGTAYDGSHGPMPALRGSKLMETRPLPGWAKDAALGDTRPIPFGPLPREHGQFLGYDLRGDSAVVRYRIGDMEVREAYRFPAARLLQRDLELAASQREQWLVVADLPALAAPADGASANALVMQWRTPKPDGVELASSVGAWDRLAIGAPSADDHLAAKAGTGAKVTFVPGFAVAHGSKDGELALPNLHDGKAAANDDDWQASVWFDKRKVDGKDDDDGRFLVDLGGVADVQSVHSYTWHKGYRSVQQYDLYASGDEKADAAAADPAKAGWQKVASVDSKSLGEGEQHGVAVPAATKCRRLLFVVRSGSAFFSEIDVFTAAHPDKRERPVQQLPVAVFGDGASLHARDGRVLLQVPPHANALSLQVCVGGDGGKQEATRFRQMMQDSMRNRTAGLPKDAPKLRWGAPIVTQGVRGADDGAFAVDTITIPLENAFQSRMRTGAFDFFRDGRAAVSTWNGDVWIVSGIDEQLERLEWRRFATGLFDPLGLRIVDDVVHVHGRDGITVLLDSDGNGEADEFHCLTNAIYATPAFHEFSFDLQTDQNGDFYVSKGAPVNPGGRGFMQIVPHHGVILKIAKDGSAVTTMATGLRAPNGIGVGPDGVLTSGDNEGTFMPRCRLNWIQKPGFFAGVKPTAQRAEVPEQPDLPLCWFPMEVDNSSGGQVWVNGDGWRDLAGRLLHLSYGTCSVYLVLKEEVAGQVQGGVVRLPANFSSSCMRGRFSAKDGQLYVVGLQGWQSSAAREGGFHRVRRTQAPLGLPVALRTCDRGVYLTFAEPLDPETATDVESYGVQVWNYLYSPNYGSPEISVLQPDRKVEQGKENRDPLPVSKATLSPDGRTVFLQIDGMRPVHQMKITWDLDAKDGRGVKGELHNSIHALAKDPGFPKEGAR